MTDEYSYQQHGRNRESENADQRSEQFRRHRELANRKRDFIFDSLLALPAYDPYVSPLSGDHIADRCG